MEVRQTHRNLLGNVLVNKMPSLGKHLKCIFACTCVSLAMVNRDYDLARRTLHLSNGQFRV